MTLADGVLITDEYALHEYRTVSTEDSSILTTWPFATEIKVTTLLVNETDAQDEADRLFALYSVRRDMYEVKLNLSEIMGVVDLGDVVTLEYPRYSLNSGKDFLVIGMELDLANEVATLTIWG
jgi:hypothetical protein